MKVAGAVILLEEQAFRYVFVTHPVVDLSIELFVKALRAPKCASRHAGVVILALPNALDQVEECVENGVNRSLSIDCSDDQIADALKSLRSIAPRSSARAHLKFTLDVGGKRNRVLSQTENLSATGMRIRGPHSYPLGTRFDFELALPDRPKPVTGVAVLVRHTRWPAESIEGFGAQFVEMDTEGLSDLEEFLRTTELERTSEA